MENRNGKGGKRKLGVCPRYPTHTKQQFEKERRKRGDDNNNFP